MVDEIEEQIIENNYCRVIITCTLDDNPISNGIVILTRILRHGDETTTEEYKLITDTDGVARKKIPYGEYTLHAEYTTNQYYSYDSNENMLLKTEEEIINIPLYRCQNEVLLNKECNYFHHDPYMTPNNYDLYFDYTKIPVNNIIESPNDLRKRLQRKLPLTKILHLNLETDEEPEYNIVHLYTTLSLSYNSIDGTPIIYRIYCNWDETLLTQQITDLYQEYVDNLEQDEEAMVMEDFMNENNLSLENLMEPVTVYMVRVINEEIIGEPLSYELNQENGFEVYTDPLDYMDNEDNIITYNIDYNKSLPCTVYNEIVSNNISNETLKIL